MRPQMEYRENTLSYEDYCRLRESAGWKNFSKIQAENALKHSLYTITAVKIIRSLQWDG